MVIKILFLFISLLLFIYGIVKFVDSDLDCDYDEAEALAIIGGIIYGIGWIVTLGTTISMLTTETDDCDCGDPRKVALVFIAMMCIGGTMFLEPFIRSLVDTIREHFNK